MFRPALILAVVAASVLSPLGTGSAAPKAPATIDHYKVYVINPPAIPAPGGINSSPPVDQMVKFANPVSKNGEPILDPDLHYSWWRLMALLCSPTGAASPGCGPPLLIRITLSNQFGDGQTWVVNTDGFLLAPALKNVSGEIPTANHYLCYNALGGPAPNVTVSLRDQFGLRSSLVGRPACYCDPVKKIHDGAVYPIVDPDAHLACYWLDPLQSYSRPITVADQFGSWTTTAVQDCFLCVPSTKDSWVFDVPQSTWGSLRRMYR